MWLFLNPRFWDSLFLQTVVISMLQAIWIVFQFPLLSVCVCCFLGPKWHSWPSLLDNVFSCNYIINVILTYSTYVENFMSHKCTAWYIFTKCLSFVICNWMPPALSLAMSPKVKHCSHFLYHGELCLVLHFMLIGLWCVLFCGFFSSTLYLWDSSTLLCVAIVYFHHCVVFNFVNIL